MNRPALLFAALAIAVPALAQPMKPKAKLPEGVTAKIDLEYVEKGHARNKLDLYLPKSEKPVPLVIWIHGGAWEAGSKNDCPALFLTEKGYAVASVNYRLSQHAVFPAQIEDCKAAVRYLRANAKTYSLDPEQFGAWGSSAGGHLVALLGTSGGVRELEGQGGNSAESSAVQAVVDFFGPTDFTKMGGSHDRAQSPESKLLGGAVPDNKDKAAIANPITYVDRADPPFLILHGDKDQTVPYNQSELLEAALKKAKVAVEFETVKGAGHGGPAFQAAAKQKQVEEFFAEHLKKAKK